MRVKMKHPVILSGVLIIILFLHGCTSSSKSSISGKLTILTGGSSNEESINISNISIYNLPRSSKGIVNVHNQLDYESRFVPDEIIVKYKPGFDPVYTLQGLVNNAYSAVTSNNNISRGAVSLLKLNLYEKSFMSPADIAKRTLDEIEYLNSLSYVEYAEPNYIYHALFVPDDPHYSFQWHYPLVNLDKVWGDASLTGLHDLSSITVAVIDTGIARKNENDHPDLMGIFRDEYDFIDDVSSSGDGDGVDNDATDPEGIASSFHGTHVIGTIGALTNNSSGVAGVAGGYNTGVKIMPIRVLGKGGTGYAYDIAQAILYAAGLPNDYVDPPAKSDIINLSLGSDVDSITIKNAISAADTAGVVIVAAAGNSNSAAPFYPAAYTEVISVSAVNPGSEKAYYSNYGSTIDLAAPGGDMTFDLNFDSYVDGVLSTLYDETDKDFAFAFYQGTSMAAPHVAGVAAMVKKALIDELMPAAPANVKDVLITSAIDLGDIDRDNYYGEGLVNAYASVKNALGDILDPELFSFPGIIKMEGVNPSADFILKNIGDASLINNISISKYNNSLWLEVSPTSGTADPTGLTVNVSVDTENYSYITDGNTYTEMLEIQSSAGTEYVYILYNINGFISNDIRDIGVVYVVAIDPETYDVIALDAIRFMDFYKYTIENLTPGSYIIGASTDRNNDGYIFEPDDAYGFYTDTNNRVVINLHAGESQKGIDFQIVDQAQ